MLASKQSSADLLSRLKTRKVLGVGETDNGDVHRSKISQLLGHNEHLFVRMPKGYWPYYIFLAGLFASFGLFNLLFTNKVIHLMGKDPSFLTTTAQELITTTSEVAAAVAGAADSKQPQESTQQQQQQEAASSSSWFSSSSSSDSTKDDTAAASSSQQPQASARASEAQLRQREEELRQRLLDSSQDSNEYVKLVIRLYGASLIGTAAFLWTFYGTNDRILARNLVTILTLIIILNFLISIWHRKLILESHKLPLVLITGLLMGLLGANYYFYIMLGSSGVRKTPSFRDLSSPRFDSGVSGISFSARSLTVDAPMAPVAETSASSLSASNLSTTTAGTLSSSASSPNVLTAKKSL